MTYVCLSGGVMSLWPCRCGLHRLEQFCFLVGMPCGVASVVAQQIVMGDANNEAPISCSLEVWLMVVLASCGFALAHFLQLVTCLCEVLSTWPKLPGLSSLQGSVYVHVHNLLLGVTSFVARADCLLLSFSLLSICSTLFLFWRLLLLATGCNKVATRLLCWWNVLFGACKPGDC